MKRTHKWVGHLLPDGRFDPAQVDEGQQSLFSWAEFMAEEPVIAERPQPQAPAPYRVLFKWALRLKQELEAELVGAGC